MILILYRLLCGYLAILILCGLFGERSKADKIAMALLLIPLVLRFLLIK